jgi:CRISPR-associated protein Cmr3
MMNRQSWNFTLLDTGFFRAGQPFHAGEGGYSRVSSHFPPPMSTLQGAIRSTLAAAYGWRPGQDEDWPEQLGDADNLGQLSLQGPYLLKFVQKGEKSYLFPAPLHLLITETPGADSKILTTFLTPGETLTCDLGTAVRLPRQKIKLAGAHLPEHFYLTRAGYTAVAEGKAPPEQEIIKAENLWLEEPRIGLKRSTESRTAEDRHLYRVGHIRPQPDLKICVIVNGLPPDGPDLLQKIVPLGGEGRLAAVEINPFTADDYRSLIPPCPKLAPAKDGQIRYTLSLITPSSSGNKGQLEQLIRKGPTNAPGRCISASIGKPQLYGGWDLEKQEPRPLQPYLPPGSTWFFEAGAEEKADIEDLHGRCIDDEAAPAYGYGQVLIGTWEVD